MKIAYSFLVGAACTVSVTAFAATAPQPAAKPHAAAQAAQQDVSKDDIAKYIGKSITVYSKLGTTHSGTVVKSTASELYIKLDSGAEMSFAVDSIKRLTTPVAPPEPSSTTPADKPADSKPSDGSAKKK